MANFYWFQWKAKCQKNVCFQNVVSETQSSDAETLRIYCTHKSLQILCVLMKISSSSAAMATKCFHRLLMGQIENWHLLPRHCWHLHKTFMGNVHWMDGWMDDLRFYVLFNSISVISGRWDGDTERLYAMEPRFRLEPGAARTRSARSVGQRLTHWATGAP